MNPIDNSKLLTYCNFNCAIVGFTPKVSFVYDAEAKTLDIQDGSAFPAPDSLKRVHVQVHDRFGAEVRGEITATGEAGKQTIDLSPLNPSKGLNVVVLVISTNGLRADGSAFGISNAGDVAYWNKK
jgi:hypothetical protein